MMGSSRSAAADTPLQSSPREADIPLSTAVRELFSGLRAGAADVADLVAAEAQVALRLLLSIVLSAVGAAMLAIFAVAGLLAAFATELVTRGVSLSTAIVVVALMCAVGSISLAFQLRALSRRALFGRSRSQLRGRQ
jgi:hypothetical protein